VALLLPATHTTSGMLYYLLMGYIVSGCLARVILSDDLLALHLTIAIADRSTV
jgi:hypothetical protein